MRLAASCAVCIILIVRLSDGHIRSQSHKLFRSARPHEESRVKKPEKWSQSYVNKLSTMKIVRKRKKRKKTDNHHYHYSIRRRRQWRETHHSQPITYVVDYSVLQRGNFDAICEDLVIDPRRSGMDILQLNILIMDRKKSIEQKIF